MLAKYSISWAMQQVAPANLLALRKQELVHRKSGFVHGARYPNSYNVHEHCCLSIFHHFSPLFLGVDQALSGTLRMLDEHVHRIARIALAVVNFGFQQGKHGNSMGL